MIMEEVDGPAALGYNNLRAFMSRAGLSDAALAALDQNQDIFAKNAYFVKQSVNDPTYNWPYDYFSLLELAKIKTKVGFRPDLEKEYQEVTGTEPPIVQYVPNVDVSQVSMIVAPNPITGGQLVSNSNLSNTRAVLAQNIGFRG